ncbi:MAG: hypothetical protein JST54_16680 [Deltaproteobacteria bacterium]|nr:hypothetical protein [Deltaproteobacteria bacterium]
MHASDAPAPVAPPPDAPIAPVTPEPVAPPPTPVPKRGPRAWYGGLSREARWVFWATLISGVWRLLFVGFIHQPWKLDFSDMHNYYIAAQHYADLGRSTDTGDWYYPSGTAAMIGFWILIFGLNVGKVLAALFQALLSTAVIPLTYVAGRRFFSDARVGTWAALLYSVHYLPMGFAGMYMSETYLTIGLAAALALLDPAKPKSAFKAGLALGYGAWAKSQAFLLAPLWALLWLWRGRRWKPGIAVGVAVVMCLVPISIVATVKSGVPAFISTNGGQTFALGQCPIRSIVYEHPKEHWRIGWSAPDLNQRTPRGEVEASWGDAIFNEPFNHSSYYMKVGLDCIRRYPKNALRAMFYHVADTFSGPPWSNIVPWPDSHNGYYVPTMISNLFLAYFIAPLAFFGLWKKRHEDGIWLAFGLPFTSLLASAVLFHGDPRFREPYDFMFMLAGMQGWFILRDRWRARKTPPAVAAEQPTTIAA